MVADVIVARHKRGAITRISLCFISCSFNETTCKPYKREHKSAQRTQRRPHLGPKQGPLSSYTLLLPMPAVNRQNCKIPQLFGHLGTNVGTIQAFGIGTKVSAR